jgi:peptidoglycan L-alanyl-D-glutamate endopeptidase CwlK
MSTKRTGPYTLDPVSRPFLKGVHPDLADVITEAAARVQFRLTDGLRTKERQAKLVAQRKSKTMNSRHITGHAVDYIAINAKGFATYHAADMIRVASVIKAVAAEKGIEIEWGGDWLLNPTDKIGWDSPHVQLSWAAYPANAVGIGTRALEAARDHPKTSGALAIGGIEAAQQTEAITTVLLDVPGGVTDGMAQLNDWMGVGDNMATVAAWVAANPGIAALCVLWGAGTMFWPYIQGGLQWVRGSR